MPIPMYWSGGMMARMQAAKGAEQADVVEEPEEEKASARVQRLAAAAAYMMVGLTTIAIASTELGTRFTADERFVYQSSLFQITAMASVLLVMMETPSQALPLLLVWMVLKYRRRLMGSAE